MRVFPVLMTPRFAARGFGLKAEDVSTCRPPQSISAALNRRTEEKTYDTQGT